MKTRLISFSEVENIVRDLVAESHRRPLDEKLILEKGAALPFVLRLCISQMKAGDSASYPEKSQHLKTLNAAAESITYKTNTCTAEEVKIQVNNAYMAFRVQ